MKKILLLILLIMIIVIPQNTVVARTVRVTETGTSLNQDISKAITEAKNDAKRKAIERVSGVSIKSSSFVTNYQLASDIIMAETIAEVKDYKILEWNVENLVKQKDREPYLQTRVVMEVAVEESEIKPDKRYQITAKLNKKIFYDGDKIFIEGLQITEPSYIYIVSVDGERVYPIVPNKYLKEFQLKTHDKISFPTRELVSKGLLLVANIDEKKEKDAEQLIIIGMKYNNSIFAKFLLENNSISVRDFSKELMRIPLNERVMQILDYETHKRM